MLDLPTGPTLAQFQEYVWSLERERGFADQTLLEKCLLLGEEVGELFKSVRKQTGMSTEHNVQVSSVAEELADSFLMLLSVANHAGVDLEQAFRAKETKNEQRVWTK